jgi:hypothetical protein
MTIRHRFGVVAAAMGVILAGCHSRSARAICFKGYDLRGLDVSRLINQYGTPDNVIDGFEGTVRQYRGDDGVCNIQDGSGLILGVKWMPKR